LPKFESRQLNDASTWRRPRSIVVDDMLESEQERSDAWVPACAGMTLGCTSKNRSRRHVLAALGSAPWWLPALLAHNAFAQTSTRPLDERVRESKIERGGLSLDIPVIVETGTSVPIVLFADPSSLKNGVRIERLGVLTPKNPRAVAMEIEIGKWMTQARITTNIRLGASQSVIGVAQLSDGSYWQHAINVVLTGSACYDGT
jgi:sulfur-oxidizing protein SoxY